MLPGLPAPVGVHARCRGAPMMTVGDVEGRHRPEQRCDRRTRVGRGATLGANCTIVCGTTIGSHAFVGAGAVVNRDVPDFALVLGVPARRMGWMSRFGERLALPASGDGNAQCEHTGDRYALRGDVLTLSENASDARPS